MRKLFLYNSYIVFFLFVISFSFLSCNTTKKVKYFQDIPDSGVVKIIPKAEYMDLKVQVDDIISITVQTLDPSATQLINSGNGATNSSLSLATTLAGTGQSSVNGQIQAPIGYLVDKDGNVSVPVFGKIQAAGYTVNELKDKITEVALKYYKDPLVIVKLSNFKINVTGEVTRPGTYIMPSEKVTLLDAISMAGDLTIFAKRDNVLLLRENADGTKSSHRVNLKKTDILSSPFFYLKQNDIIYVEPGPGKASSTDASQAKYYTIAGTLLSLLIVIFTRK